MSAEFDCRATAALLRSGSTAVLAGHAAALMSVLAIGPSGIALWIAFCAVVVWSVVVYLAIRVKIDVGLFELLAEHPTEELDEWLKTARLRDEVAPRTIAERRTGALKLWRRLVVAVGIEVALALISLVVRLFS